MGRIMNVFCESGNASVYNIREVNSSFAVASLDVMYTGENPNMEKTSGTLLSLLKKTSKICIASITS